MRIEGQHESLQDIGSSLLYRHPAGPKMLTCVCNLRCKLLVHAISAGLLLLGGLFWGIGADQSASVSSDLFLVDGEGTLVSM